MYYESLRNSRFSWFLALLFLTQASWAQTANRTPADSVNAIVQSHMRSKHIPGVTDPVRLKKNL